MAGKLGSMAKSPHYYEADGALRAYANRMAFVSGGLALVVVALAIGVIMTRVKPPTVIRVAADGTASVISPEGQGSSQEAIINVKAEEEPTPLDRQHFVETFVKNYMGYDEHTLAENWTTSLNMETSNLKQRTLQQMQQDNTVGQLQQQHTRSFIAITSTQADPTDPLTWHVYATRKVSKISDQREAYQKLAEAYTVRLVEGTRDVDDPSGLMVAEFHSQQISTDSDSQ
jgi:type IV secretory pathway component VirB8